MMERKITFPCFDLKKKKNEKDVRKEKRLAKGNNELWLILYSPNSKKEWKTLIHSPFSITHKPHM